ncbi:heme exporter protein CcmD [Fulvimarina endophytica]|uniref:Heme exporter protein D n=1 Tax=Fulvimarina endophytica TaxID=2293836 RepID=A0A371X7U3_9HYPH|nr:heme exporter protein CcmD [Fulvimarina endophytica]RFC65319.1 heme exporter protein CcmD [Fulvimarina endophytica]
MSGAYTGFILAAYGFSALAIGGLGLWTYLDARAQRRALADLDARGIRRRSDGSARSDTQKGAASR